MFENNELGKSYTSLVALSVHGHDGIPPEVFSWGSISESIWDSSRLENTFGIRLAISSKVPSWVPAFDSFGIYPGMNFVRNIHKFILSSFIDPYNTAMHLNSREYLAPLVLPVACP